MEEIWKDVIGYEGLYKVSNLGRVKSLPRNGTIKTERVLVQKIAWNKRKQIALNKDDKRKSYCVHRLVAKAFLGLPKEKHEVNHIDGNPQNNEVSNLEWVTKSDNIKHAYRIGLKSLKGESHNQNKLTEKQVLKIRKLYAEKKYNTVELAKKFKVCRPNISLIVNRKNWSHI